jgi:putative membrane protein
MRPGYFLHYHGFGWFFWPHLLGAGLMSLFWLGLLGLLIWAALRLLRGRPGPPADARVPRWSSPTPPSGMTATEILRQRYARGEIDAVTFQQMMERLQATAPSDEPPDDTYL